MEGRQGTTRTTAPLGEQQPTEHLFFQDYPIGYRFDPFDDELILHYLKPKIEGSKLPLNLMHDVNIYKYNPDDLILDKKHRPQGKNTWYFFTSRDKKYKNGSRPSRSAGSGYWKATGADRIIEDEDGVKVGYRKALVFYIGKPPKGEKTHWIMHEYRIDGPPNRQTITEPSTSEDTSMRLDDYVLCRIYKKVDRRRKSRSQPKKKAGKRGAKKHVKPDPTQIKEAEEIKTLTVVEPQFPVNNVVGPSNDYNPPETCYDDIFDDPLCSLDYILSSASRPPLPPLSDHNSFHGDIYNAPMMDFNGDLIYSNDLSTPSFPYTQDQLIFPSSSLDSTMAGPLTSPSSIFGDAKFLQ